MRQSPLAHLGLTARATDARGEAGVALSEQRFPAIVDLRGGIDDAAFAKAVESALAFALPREACTATHYDGVSALWMGPDQWWIVSQGNGAEMADKLRQALDGQHAAVTDISDSRVCIRVAGPRSRDLLAKGCPLDLHPRVFGSGRCAGTLLAKAGVTLHQVAGDEDADGPAFVIYTTRSFADYLWRWLEDAAQEYGVAVLAG